MKKQLIALAELQTQDRKMMKMAREIRDIPARRQLIEDQLAGNRAAVAEVEQKLKENTVAVKNREVEVELIQAQLLKYKTQQMTVKTNEEYRAILGEISAVQKKIKAQEDIEIELMEQAEGLRTGLEDAQARLAEAEARVKGEKEALEERLALLQAKVDKMQAVRKERIAEMDQALVRHYTRIMNNKRDFALVPVENGVCGGCHMKLTPQMAHDAASNMKLVVCSHCGRMLYGPE